ncbi:tRNA lysidine(34) synthetase TilS [Paucibacter sp. B51]|uniref:tRNA lysidine(34) synthetase TilS n=1 Tax=Paucibacter sp. B51 TaxID=2993315 RepID=UPI0022EBA4B7|nr:tRNA lysidine(34) synthetase TilS [Paucibacter sp. B51]
MPNLKLNVDLAQPRLVAVAFSGGRDSTALLYCVARQAQALNRTLEAPVQVLALHVHHGLSSQADVWLQHGQTLCREWAAQGLPVEFRHRRLAGEPAAGQSIEAWAREGRYAALAEMAIEAGATLILMAHHRRDQAETLLLQALRGGGVAGLAGMPRLQQRGGNADLVWARPWLQQGREAIEAYVEVQGLSFVEDESNSDPRYSRNRLRLQVWPALAQAFPAAERSLALGAQWAQQALALQREMAEQDLPALLSPQGLHLPALRTLSPARASNALRAWLHQQTGQVASARRVTELLAREDVESTLSWPCGPGVLHLYREHLSWQPALQAGALVGEAKLLDLSRPGVYPQPDWGGAWEVVAASDGGVLAESLAQVCMRARQGGEQFQRQPRGVARGLKKAYQSAALPAWHREGPLLLKADTQQVLFAPGLGLDARSWAPPGVPQLQLRWLRLGESEPAPDA